MTTALRLQLDKPRINRAKRVRLDSNVDSAESTAEPIDAKSDTSVVKDLDSYLKTLDGEVGTGAVNEDLDAIETATKVPIVSNNKKKNKLDTIVANYSTLPFEKILISSNRKSDEESEQFRLKRRISIDKPFPVMESWHAAGLPLPLMNVISQFNKPTPIQAQALPVLMRGHDFLGIAPTGSGKTVSFMVPMARHVSANRANYSAMQSKGGPFAVVLVPTRELCVQIRNELEPFARALQLHALSCYGGSDIADQITQIVRGHCEIIVATPGRLIDLLAANSGRVLSLQAVTFLVVDETDRMFDLGFGPQVRKIVSAIRPDRQTVVFSATMSPSIEKLVERVLHDPVKVTVGFKSTVPTCVKQEAFVVAPQNKFRDLVKILPKSEASLVFVNTQTLADSLSLQLNAEKFQCQALHGGMDQRDRDATISDFRSGKLLLLVATSIAARGLDVRQLKYVINYDPATHIEDYIHRAGRTGRAGESGTCVTFFEPSQGRQAFELSQLFDVGLEAKKLADSYSTKQSDKANEIDPTDTKKTGGSKFTNGFGGHGLSKLDKIRDFHRSVEAEAYSDTPTVRTPSQEPETTVLQMGNLFIARLNINDISKEARVAATSLPKQYELTENFHVTITLKGAFIAHPKPNTTNEQKLHLQIEGATHGSVFAAYSELLELINNKSAHQQVGRYSSF